MSLNRRAWAGPQNMQYFMTTMWELRNLRFNFHGHGMAHRSLRTFGSRHVMILKLEIQGGRS